MQPPLPSDDSDYVVNGEQSTLGERRESGRRDSRLNLRLDRLGTVISRNLKLIFPYTTYFEQIENLKSSGFRASLPLSSHDSYYLSIYLFSY